MYYRKALKNSHEQVFEQSECGSNSILWDFVPSFFKNDEPGIHLLAVCLPPDEALPDDQRFEEALSLDNNPCTKLDDAPPDNCTFRYYVISRKLPDYSTILKMASQYAKQCYKAENLFLNTLDFFSNYLTSRAVAEGLQNELEVLIQQKKEEGCCHTLFVIVALPEECFSQFEDGQSFFPPFIEYVVLGESVEKIITERVNKVTQYYEEKVAELIKEIAEQNKKIAEQNKTAEHTKQAYAQEIIRERESYEAEIRMFGQIILRMNNGIPLTEEMRKKVDSILKENLPPFGENKTQDKQLTKTYLNS